MAEYIVQRMAYKDYANFMAGGYDYSTEKVRVCANSKEEAIAIALVEAESAGYCVNTEYVLTEAEAEALEARRAADYEAYKRNEAMKKQKRVDAEACRAAAAGMTVTEYRAAQALKRYKKRLMNEIAALEEELADKRQKLARLDERV